MHKACKAIQDQLAPREHKESLVPQERLVYKAYKVTREQQVHRAIQELQAY